MIKILDIFRKKPQVIPSTEPIANFEGVKLERGKSYVVKETRSDSAYHIFVSIIRSACAECSHLETFPCESIGCELCTLSCSCKKCIYSRAQGVCFTTRSPVEIREKYLIQTTPIFWISKHGPESVNPADLEIMAGRINDFFKRSKNPVVMLDGIEYLVITNGFIPVLKFLHDIREMVILKKAIFILPLCPATFDDRENALIQKICDDIDSKTVSL
ncbi:MAG: DUF835 domain-containing protein [Candidatus Methanoperedens sp.]